MSIPIHRLLAVTLGGAALFTTNPLPAQTECLPAPAGLVSWWRAEGNTLDSAGVNNGIADGGLTFGPGEVGEGFVFNGTNADLHVPASPSTDLGAGGSFSVEGWINPVNPAAEQPIAEWNSGYFGVNFWLSAPTPSGGGPGSLWLDVRDIDLVQHPVFTAGNLVASNVWQHVAFTYDAASGIATIYLNGSVVQEVTVGVVRGYTTGDFWLGYRPYDGGAGMRFTGEMDEFSLYGQALSAAEVLAVYSAGSAGKCPLPPVITAQPRSQAVVPGTTVVLSVAAGGTQPLYYQWLMDSNVISGATGSSLVLANVQPTNAGTYSVVVSNVVNTASSSNAVLTILPPGSCFPAPAGGVSWWRGEGNTLDSAGANNGTADGGLAYAPGEVGQAFAFDGTSADVHVPASSSTDVGAGGSFTIELWVNPENAAAEQPMTEWNSGYYGVNFWLSAPAPAGGGAGSLWADVRDISLESHPLFSASGLVVSKVWQHVALTYDKPSGVATLYLNGAAVKQATVGAVRGYTTGDFWLGYRPYDGGAGMRFTGQMDEVSLYTEALSAAEILEIYGAGSAGKCGVLAAITTQPTNETVTVGADATFAVAAIGTPPFAYQWLFNSNVIAGATLNSLTLTNVQMTNSGIYSVVVSNATGVVVSSDAVLTVNFPPALVEAGNAGGIGAHAVTVPIFLVANGNENALSFTLDFNSALLTYTGVVPGIGAPGAALLPNATQAGSGLVSVELALPSGATFAPGTQEVADVTFSLAIVTSNSTAGVSFGSQLVESLVVDPFGWPLPANFAGGTVSIAQSAIAGDVSPRPNGNEVVNISDWVQEGRYVAGLDTPTNASEFARADCAPRDTGGDGQITIIDWVQVGRYAAELDPLTPAGTNTGGLAAMASKSVLRTHSPGPVKYGGAQRQVQVQNAVILQGQSGTVSVNLQALGDENALGFSLSFNPSVLTYVGASAGSGISGVSGAQFDVNAKNAASGQLGIVLALGPGSSLASGNLQVATVKFSTLASASGIYPVALVSQPVVCQVSDPNAQALTNTTYLNGAVIVSQPPALGALLSGQSIQLSWPLWASNFVLQQASGPLSSSMNWSNVATNAATATLPLGQASMFYRLIQQ